ncbi:hypothetical protein AAG570_010208 [Ranatra chinensis]|uniref:Uncharacterized protein n=1 Tax=Ranatra chinensis TaxID=642074 RepID=A0ABD0YLW2_9HEMI
MEPSTSRSVPSMPREFSNATELAGKILLKSFVTGGKTWVSHSRKSMQRKHTSNLLTLQGAEKGLTRGAIPTSGLKVACRILEDCFAAVVSVLLPCIAVFQLVQMVAKFAVFCRANVSAISSERALPAKAYNVALFGIRLVAVIMSLILSYWFVYGPLLRLEMALVTGLLGQMGFGGTGRREKTSGSEVEANGAELSFVLREVFWRDIEVTLLWVSMLQPALSAFGILLTVGRYIRAQVGAIAFTTRPDNLVNIVIFVAECWVIFLVVKLALVLVFGPIYTVQMAFLLNTTV